MSGSLHPQLRPESNDSQVTGTLDSGSFPSAPPDIRNWFSSYVYESPELTSEDFRDLEASGKACIEGEKKRLCGEIRNVDESKEDFIAAAEESSDGIVDRRDPDECEHRKSAALDVHDVEPRTMSSSILDQWTIKPVGEQKLLGETQNNNHGSVTRSRPATASIHNASNDTKLDYSLIDRTNDNMLHGEHNNYHQERDGQSPAKSIRRNKSISEILGKENLYGVASPEIQEDFRGSGPIETAKESDGFISTRKNTQQANTARNIVIPRDEQQLVSNFRKCANKNRKVLSEKSDFHYPDALGITGKWQRPQKNKPHLRPPLKQLRLERWVRRT